MTNNFFDTISAIATPLQTGAVGIIRISGEKAFLIIEQMFAGKKIEAGKVCYGWIVDNGQKIDEVIVLPFVKPHSFTGEDVIEIHCHGGLNVLKSVLNLTYKFGARPAERGEFTKRAFLNKKMDLSQAEAVLDLIEAKTQTFAQKSANNLAGTLFKFTEEIRKKIFDLLSKMVAAIDFPEDVAEVEYDFIIEEIESAISSIKKILETAQSSNIMRQGIKIAILGRPNVGKSSLFNNLLNQKRAIVTEIAGTTRDVIQETVDIEGLCATLIDTAGIREDKNIDKVEKIGIDYSKNSVEQADLVLFLYDGQKGLTKEDEQIFSIIQDKQFIKIATKSDLCSSLNDFAISNITGKNLDILKQKIKEKITNDDFSQIEFVTNQRQQKCLQDALQSLETALNAAKREELQDLITIDIKSALLALGELTGEVVTDDILNKIFENFCIGK